MPNQIQDIEGHKSHLLSNGPRTFLIEPVIPLQESAFSSSWVVKWKAIHIRSSLLHNSHRARSCHTSPSAAGKGHLHKWQNEQSECTQKVARHSRSGYTYKDASSFLLRSLWTGSLSAWWTSSIPLAVNNWMVG